MSAPAPPRAGARPAPRRHSGPPPPRRPRPGKRGPDPRFRLTVGLIVILFVLSLVAGKLLELQGLNRTSYSAMAQRQRLHTLTITAPRGAILDRSGVPLAETVDARDVYADPHEITNATGTAAALAPLLGSDAATLAAKLTAATTFVYLARAVPPTLAAQVIALDKPGIGVLPTTKRVYPDGRLASNLIGFVHIDGSGAEGLEAHFQSVLAGHDGAQTFEAGASGSPIPDGRDVVTQARPGTTLQLTIDRDIQWQAQQAIAKQVKAVKADSGTVIVMDPRTGRLLAVAVAPGFDANSPPADITSRPIDPAVSETYEPGSVNKVITMSAALQEGLVAPTTPFTIPPVLHFAGATFHDAEQHGTERLTLAGVLAKSSNIGTIQVARRLGADKLYSYLRAYGFGSLTGTGLPGDQDGLLPPVAAWSQTTMPTVAFGQGIGVTAMQVASVYATIANGGVRVAPNIVAATIDGDGHRHAAKPPAVRRVISGLVAHELSDMLEAVTSNEGTAPAARIPGYRIAGKTGTAQRSVNGRYSGYTASFVGFAPADKPQLLVEVVMQNPRSGHFGGIVSAPVFHDVMSFALQSLGIAPTGTRPPKATLTW
jgi:cell division protein FtsI (penicillin-binding protein 3)